MDEKMIPFYAHEAETARLERTIKRLWILCIIIFIAFVGSNAAWMYYESQFMDVQTEVTHDLNTDGGGTITNGDVTIYGETETDG